MNNNSPHVQTTPTYRVEGGMGEVEADRLDSAKMEGWLRK